MDIEFLQNRLRQEVEGYNRLVQAEQELHSQLEQVHEQRVVAFGRMTSLQETVAELQLADESVALGSALSPNGNVTVEVTDAGQ